MRSGCGELTRAVVLARHYPIAGVEWRQRINCCFGLFRHHIFIDIPEAPHGQFALRCSVSRSDRRWLSPPDVRRPPGRAKRKSGRCQPKCAECYTCKKGQCHNKNGRKRCAKGKCKPKSDGAPCRSFAGGLCINRTCVNPQTDEANCGALGTAFGPTQVCQAGSCFPRSTCPATLTVFCPAIFGTPCGSSCWCNQSSEGNIVCVDLAGSFCAPPDGTATPCTTSATCPPGSACVDTSGCCGVPGIRTCVPQCPAPAA
jgi:hypothetical protein